MIVMQPSMRSGAELLTGNQVAVARRVALCEPGDCVVVVDLARYDRWVIEAVTQARERQAWILAITDSVLSPLAGLADATLLVSAGALSPFDSHVGTLALMNLLITGLASSLRTVATKRLDSAERAWKTYDQLVDR